MFYEEMANECEIKNENELLICLGDANGHIGKEVDEFGGVHEGFGIGKKSIKGRLLLEFCVEMNLGVGNSWFKKRIIKRLLSMEGVVECIDCFEEGEAEEVFEGCKDEWM